MSSRAPLPDESVALPGFQPDQLQRARRARGRQLGLEWLFLILLAFLYARSPLLDFNPSVLQQTSEHNEASTLHLVTEQALRHGVLPLWNPYMSSGFPVAGDFISNFWNPFVTLPVWLFGGINGYKVSAFLAFIAAALGQWTLCYVLGVRGTLPRLWASALFMLSGGLALFWRLGWHQLLVGAAWFPWAFAALVWALRSRARAPLGWSALAIVMVLTSAGAYYYLYLGVSLPLLALLLVAVAPASERLSRLKRSGAIALLAAGLLAVVLLPGLDVYRFTERETLGDAAQSDSQPIIYALFNYVVSDPSWFNQTTLGKGAETWFYIGVLPLAALIFLPLAWSRRPGRRQAIAIATLLSTLFLMWHANRYTVIGELYERFPLLYQFRFAMRLLTIATSPLLLLSALALQGLWETIARHTRDSTMKVEVDGRGGARVMRVPVRSLALALFGLVLAGSIYNVFRVNQPFAFTLNQRRDANSSEIIAWLHERDPELYSIQAGDYRIWWWWTPSAYEMQQPVLNFAYNRRTKSFVAQQREGAVVRATAKYIIPWDDNQPSNLPYLGQVATGHIYENPDALPYAFAVAPWRLEQETPLVRSEVQPMQARWDNPNRLTVFAEEGRQGEQLIALVSLFPGWKVYVDGQPAELEPVNQYLGVTMREGAHTYTFSFEPPLFFLGLAISAASLLVTLWIASGADARRIRRRLAERLGPHGRTPPLGTAPP